MSDDPNRPIWTVRRGARRLGPLSWGELTALSAASQILPTDEISSDGESWQPAADVQGLTFRAMPSGSPALDYDAPRVRPTLMTGFACDMLIQTSPYARIVSILIFLAAALMVASGVAIGVPGLDRAGFRGAAIVALLYFVFAVIAVVPASYLARYATHCRRFAKLHDPHALESALSAQKSFWKFTATFAILLILLYFAVLAVALGIVFVIPRPII